MEPGDVIQFCDMSCTIYAAIYRGRDHQDRNIVIIDYKANDGTVVRGARIRVHEIISDEDAANKNLDFR